LDHLKDVLDRHESARIRIVTGDYLGVTEPDALVNLLDLPQGASIRIFESGGQSFHPKAYVIHQMDGHGVALVGSSNLSKTALSDGVEWNYRVLTDRDGAGFRDVVDAFEALWQHPKTRPLDRAWIDSYRRRRKPPLPTQTGVPGEPPPPPPIPHLIQQEALRALTATRAQGHTAGLIVLATGLGKTWLSAFDTAAMGANRVLFVAHREEILNQALETFRRIRPTALLGKYTGTERLPDADVLFASIQTLGRQAHLDRFARDAFDYIVVDEFHHAAARTYRRLIEHFTPRFLLGLTATPERTDGGDLLSLCGENLVYECTLVDGIAQGLLCPFRYFGVPDDVDYTNIPWRSSRFDEEALTTAVATDRRARNAYEQFLKHRGTRAIGFCVSQRHADFMADWFRRQSIQAVAVHAGPSSAPRAQALEELAAGRLEIIFAVDIFNEGVDLPQVDTILMLRPTESRILWLQQFGRGLRYQPGKTLTVVDYIGNHRSFLLKPRALLDLGPEDGLLRAALRALADGSLELPPGCSVTYELQAREIIESLLRPPRREEALENYYAAFVEATGSRPTASEALHDGYDPRAVRQGYGSWLGFVRSMEGLSATENAAWEAYRGFFEALEQTEMARSYKMLLLLAMLSRGQIPGQLTIGEIVVAFTETARRYAALQPELAEASNSPAMQQLLERNPIAAWVGGRGTGGVAYFTYRDGTFATALEVAPAHREAVSELVREIAEWRLAQYVRRLGVGGAAGAFECKVSHAGGRPIIFLPDRERLPTVPHGWQPVTAEGQLYRASFQKVAVNLLLSDDAESNQLPTVLRGWFGEDAGLPGTQHRVVFEPSGSGWTLRPASPTQVSGANSRPILWSSYRRDQIPGLFGLPYQERLWQSGIISKPGHVFLLVTLEKEDLPAEHRYQDRFLNASELQWQSQNRMARDQNGALRLANHRQSGLQIHLFVRRAKRDDAGAAPFIYCGELQFQRWEGDKPITVCWRLELPVPERLWASLGILPARSG
jgi:superfamily II DNA or RNA helicase